MTLRLLSIFISCLCFAPLAAAQSSLQERTEQFLKTHTNKENAQRIVQLGFARLSNPSLSHNATNKTSAEKSDTDFFNNALSQLHNVNTANAQKAASFLNKKFHRPTKSEIAANTALFRLPPAACRLLSVSCHRPYPSIPAADTQQSEAFSAAVSAAPLKRLLLRLTTAFESTVEHRPAFTSVAALAAAMPSLVQRTAPLLI